MSPLGYKQAYRRKSQTGNSWGSSGPISHMWSAYHPASGVESVWPERLLILPSQPIDATQALNLCAGVSNCNVFLGRSFS